MKKLKRKLKALAFITILILGVTMGVSKAVTVMNTVNGKELPIYSVETEEKKVALSFDAAWGNEDTQILLDILEKYNIKTTFFMTGAWVESFPEDVKRIYAAGHDIGNHSESHPNMSQLSKEACQQELMLVHEKVKKLIGEDMDLFRPPYGDYDNEVVTTATECGYYSIQWSVDILDIKVKIR